MTLTRRSLLTSMVSLVLAWPAQAKDEWVVLGKRSVQLIRDRDIIVVGLSGGLFTGLKLAVSGNAVYIESLRVSFPNGEDALLPVRSYIEDGGTTRELLLPGLVRGIRSVELVYRRSARKGSATVTVFGRRRK